jgi:hypothetical protein
MRSSVRAVAVTLLSTTLAAPAEAFVRLVEAGDPAPGEEGTFSELEAPSYDGRRVAFRARSNDYAVYGVFRVDEPGHGARIADTTTAQPGGSGSFNAFGQAFDYPSIDAGEVVFNGSGGAHEGVYRGDGGPLTLLVDDTTSFPGAPGPLRTFSAPSSDGTFVVAGSDLSAIPFFAGVYAQDPLPLFTVIDTTYVPPVGAGFYNVDEPVVGAGLFAFQENGTPSGPHAIYVAPQTPTGVGDLELVVSTGDPMPDRPGHFFGAVLFPQLDRAEGNLCFWADDGGSEQGFFLWDRQTGSLALVADTETTILRGTGTFTSFSLYCSIQHGDVIFAGLGANGQHGIYHRPRLGALGIVVDGTNELDGTTAYLLEVSREAVVDGRVAFRAVGGFGDAIFIPEPEASGGVALLALAAAALGVRRASVRPS